MLDSIQVAQASYSIPRYETLLTNLVPRALFPDFPKPGKSALGTRLSAYGARAYLKKKCRDTKKQKQNINAKQRRGVVKKEQLINGAIAIDT